MCVLNHSSSFGLDKFCDSEWLTGSPYLAGSCLRYLSACFRARPRYPRGKGGDLKQTFHTAGKNLSFKKLGILS